ncbi:MAG: hypothetical protein ACM65L_13130 [Microcoleus sp.]
MGDLPTGCQKPDEYELAIAVMEGVDARASFKHPKAAKNQVSLILVCLGLCCNNY